MNAGVDRGFDVSDEFRRVFGQFSGGRDVDIAMADDGRQYVPFARPLGGLEARAAVNRVREIAPVLLRRDRPAGRRAVVATPKPSAVPESAPIN